MENKQGKKTVLVVDDDLPILHALIDKLSREGFTVIQATEGEEGLAKALQYHPDLILLDIIMPKMDGLAMMKKLRTENGWGKTVPIILLTNLSPDQEYIKKSVVEDKPVYYLVKTNWSMADITGMVKEVLDIKE